MGRPRCSRPIRLPDTPSGQKYWIAQEASVSDMSQMKTPARRLAFPVLSSSADQKQHSNIAVQQAIRSPQQSEAAKAAPPHTSPTAAAASVVFIIGLLDEIETETSSQASVRGGGTSGTVSIPEKLRTGGTGRKDTSPTKACAASSLYWTGTPQANTQTASLVSVCMPDMAQSV